ncbi:MAG: HMA2 domain-containing protein [Desulfomonilaceae bacterium]
MIPEAHVSHRMTRRLRIKIPSKKGDISYFSNLREQVSKWPDVEEITVNPQIGSALIVYTGKTTDVLQLARENELFRLKKVGRSRTTLFESAAHTFRTYNTNLKQISGGEVDIPTLVFLSLLISGIWQIARGSVAMPAWYTAFYYALGIFTRAQVDELDEGGELLEEFGDADGD